MARDASAEEQAQSSWIGRSQLFIMLLATCALGAWSLGKNMQTATSVARLRRGAVSLLDTTRNYIEDSNVKSADDVADLTRKMQEMQARYDLLEQQLKRAPGQDINAGAETHSDSFLAPAAPSLAAVAATTVTTVLALDGSAYPAPAAGAAAAAAGGGSLSPATAAPGSNDGGETKEPTATTTTTMEGEPGNLIVVGAAAERRGGGQLVVDDPRLRSEARKLAQELQETQSELDDAIADVIFHDGVHHHIVEKIKDRDLVVLVQSSRGGRARRDGIRASWAHGHDNVFFIVGDKGCAVPKGYRVAGPNEPIAGQKTDYSCHPAAGGIPLEAQAAHDAELKREDAALKKEQAIPEAKLILVPMVDSYRALPRKLKESYRWGLKHAPAAKWFLKVDDDSVARVKELEFLLGSTRSEPMTSVGHIRRGSGVPRGGKWADWFKPNVYPPFANGAQGHVVSRSAAQAVVDHDGVEYQGEDVSLGIWLDEIGKKTGKHVEYTHWPQHFVAHGNCNDRSKVLIGHNIAVAQMKACFPNGPKVPPKGCEGQYSFQKNDAKKCHGLYHVAEGDASAEACKKACCDDNYCADYQWLAKGAESGVVGGCWMGACTRNHPGNHPKWVGGTRKPPMS